MNTIDTTLTNFLIDYSDARDYVQQVNSAVARLISNDVVMTMDAGNAPDIWQYRWRAGQNGYGKGEAVWINTDTVDDIVANHCADIIDFIEGNFELRELCAKADDPYDFYAKVVNGKALPGLSALFWPGDIKNKAQIRVSKESNNTTLPDSDKWEDFFRCDSDEESTRKILSCLADMTARRLSVHMQDYHDKFSQFDPENYMEKTENAISGIPQAGLQQFSDHTYTIESHGIDYVKRQGYWKSQSNPNVKKWFRLWNSGYLEYGGIVDTGSGSPTKFDVKFADASSEDWPSFNYPLAGGKFYQQGYASCDNPAISNIQSAMRGDLRYSLTVQPMSSGSIGHPYETSVKDGRYYVSRDVFKMDNQGFSFICDVKCRYYSYYASGFTTPL